MKEIRPGRLIAVTLLLAASVVTSARAEAPLTLDEALARVLEHSPHLLAAEQSRQAALARVDQADRRPNPELEAEWENIAGTGELSGVGASEVAVMVSQDFELGGKRGHRRELAVGESDVADRDRRALHLDLMLQTREAFVDVWAAQSRAALAAEGCDLFADLLRETERRMAAGAASTVELSRTRAGLAAAELDRRRRQTEQRAACRRLAALWGGLDVDFTSVAGDFEAAEATVFPEGAAALLADNPDLARLRSQETLRQLARQVAESAATPDLSLGLGIKRDNGSGDQSFVIGAGLPLPLFDRNKDELRAIGYGIEQIRHERAAVETALRTELALLQQEEMAALDEIGTLRDTIIPEATTAFDETLDGHRRGLFSFTDVLETRRFLFELQESYIDALVAHHLAAARIARLIGADDTREESS